MQFPGCVFVSFQSGLEAFNLGIHLIQPTFDYSGSSVSVVYGGVLQDSMVGAEGFPSGY